MGRHLRQKGMRHVIKHIVMWTFAEAEGRSKDENIAEAKRRLDRCDGIVDGMGLFEVVPAQDGLEASYDLALYSEFDSLEALQAYVAHPVHADASGFVSSVRQARVAFDYDPAAIQLPPAGETAAGIAAAPGAGVSSW